MAVDLLCGLARAGLHGRAQRVHTLDRLLAKVGGAVALEVGELVEGLHAVLLDLNREDSRAVRWLQWTHLLLEFIVVGDHAELLAHLEELHVPVEEPRVRGQQLVLRSRREDVDGAVLLKAKMVL